MIDSGNAALMPISVAISQSGLALLFSNHTPEEAAHALVCNGLSCNDAGHLVMFKLDMD